MAPSSLIVIIQQTNFGYKVSEPTLETLIDVQNDHLVYGKNPMKPRSSRISGSED
jgi:hypothetical protein